MGISGRGAKLSNKRMNRRTHGPNATSVLLYTEVAQRANAEASHGRMPKPASRE